MGTKYSSVSAVNYNASPPSDDGAQTSQNKAKWSDVKTKIGDPVKTEADTINTRLIEHFDIGPDTKSTTYTTVAADFNTVLECSGTFTVSLLDASTAGAGYFTIVKNAGSGNITVDTDTPADQIDGNTSIVLVPGEVAQYGVNNAADGYMQITAVTRQSVTNNTVFATIAGTAILQAGIPTTAKHIAIMFGGVLTSGTSVPMIQLGVSSVAETTGYLGRGSQMTATAQAVTSYTTGFGLAASWTSTQQLTGVMTLDLIDSSNNTWNAGGGNADTTVGNNTVRQHSGFKSLAGPLDSIILTTVGGTDTFVNGNFNISYSG